MRDFDDIYAIAADRKGGGDALEALLSHPLSPSELAATADDRWLSAMAKCLFQAGFNWKETKEGVEYWHNIANKYKVHDVLSPIKQYKKPPPKTF